MGMADEVQTGGENSPAYEPDATYNIKLSRLVVFGHARLIPRGEILVKGNALTRIVKENGADVILSAERI
jgi:hypothetical protein